MTVLILGDTHHPFSSFSACQKAWRIIQKNTFTHVIQIGDLLDQYAFSTFAKKNLFMADRELRDGRKMAEDMWSVIRKAQPKAELHQLLGNHDVRIMKRTQEKLPEVQDLVRDSVIELYQFEGVHTVHDPRDELIIGDIAFLHGYRSKLGDHTRFMQMSTVHGHTHKGGVYFTPVRDKLLFELDVGYLADPDSPAMRYTEQKTTNWMHGVGIIDFYGPRFVPF